MSDDDDDLDDEGSLEWADDTASPDAGPYATTAHAYLAAGWAPLPLPAGEKFPPPTGWTGQGAPWPSAADVQAWIDGRPGANIAIRLPPTVLGIDMDCYHGKPGAQTIADHEARRGQLPATWSSTSRTDGSRIRFYRIPEGLAWPGVLPGGGVETIRTGHRYAVTWPSIHPDTQQPYRWHDPAGRAVDTIPDVADLPALPATWVHGLTEGRQAVDIARAGLDATAARAWVGGPDRPCRLMQAATAKACTDLTRPGASRHDTAVLGTQWLAHLAAEGHPGLAAALAAVEVVFTAALGTDRDAGGEWRRLTHGAVDIAAASGHDRRLGDPCDNPFSGLLPTRPTGAPAWTTPSTASSAAGPTSAPQPATSASNGTGQHSSAAPVAASSSSSSAMSSTPSSTSGSASGASGLSPTTNPATAPAVATATAAAGSRTESTSTAAGTADSKLSTPVAEADAREHTSWWPKDLTAVIAGKVVRPPCGSLYRDDGQALFYRGRTNALLAPSESGKSWVAGHAVVQHLQRGERVYVLDMEDDEVGFVGRLIRMGATPGELANLDYADPDEAFHAGAQVDVYEALTDRGPYGLILIDGVNAAFSLLGFKMNDNDHATQFAQRFTKPFEKTGAAVIVVDHTPKNEDPANVSKGGIGAQAKRAMITGCSIRITVKKQPAPGETGLLTLNIDKDKHGSARLASRGGKWAGTAVIEDTPGGLVQVRIDAPGAATGASGDAGAWKPTVLMTKVSRYLDTLNGEGVSGNEIEKGVGGRAEYVRKALDELVEQGYVKRSAGARGAVLHHQLKPFNGEEIRPRPTSSPPRPDLVPDEVEVGEFDLVPLRPTSHDEVMRDEVDEVKADRPPTPPRPRPISDGLVPLDGGRYLDPHTGEITKEAGAA